MTKEQEQLLMKDLCGRLPYGVKASYYGPEEECECIDEIEGLFNDGQIDIGQYGLDIWKVRPYLFPLSSMTEEQKVFFDKKSIGLDKYGDISTKEDNYGNPFYADLSDYLEVIDWLNAHHFDYRGLIEQGLAIDATGLNIYKEEQQ